MTVIPRIRKTRTHATEQTGPLPAVVRVGRHHVTSETPDYWTARTIVASASPVRDGRYVR